MVNFFAQVGFGQWLRYFLGVLEVGSAVMLFFPRQAFYGAVVLCVSLVGSTRPCSTVPLRFSRFCLRSLRGSLIRATFSSLLTPAVATPQT